MLVSNHVKGVLLALAGVLLISPDSLLIRLLNLDMWTVFFLRGSFIALTLLPLSILSHSDSLGSQIKRMDRYAWGMVLLMAVSSLFFVASIRSTSVAHTLVIVGAVPVFAAILGLYFLHERVSLRTWLTIAVVFVGLIFVVYDQQQSSLLGDLMAFATCIMWALNFVLARKTSTTNIILVMMLSGCVMMAISLPAASLSSIDLQQALIGALLGALNGLALSLLFYAPRFIPSAEVAVFLPGEAVLGTLLVWWVFGEYPGMISLLAGGIIICTIAINSYLQMRTPD